MSNWTLDILALLRDFPTYPPLEQSQDKQVRGCYSASLLSDHGFNKKMYRCNCPIGHSFYIGSQK